MNDAIVWRLMWKEYRAQRGFWLSIAVLSLTVQLVALLAATMRGEEIPLPSLYGMAVVAVALYAVGCGATMFATEREAGTYDFQRSLPVSARRYFLSKLVFAAASTMVLAVLLWLATVVVAGGRLPRASDHQAICSAGLIVALEMLAWGMFFSLVLRQPLLAVILAIATTSIGMHVIVPSIVGHYDYQGLGTNHYISLMPYRLFLVLGLLLVDTWLGHRWFQERYWRLGTNARTERVDVSQSAAQVADTPAPGRARSFLALMWQQVRQSWLTIVVLAAAYPVLFAWPLLSSTRTWRGVLGDASVLATFCLVPLAAILGCCVFSADQVRGRYRFFVDRGIRPQAIWLSRQVMWLAPLLVLLAIAGIFACTCLVALGPSSSARMRAEIGAGTPALFAIAARYVCAVAACYAAGQACSMFFRSPVLAFTFGLFASVALCGWSMLMFLGGVPWIWSVAPIPIVLLIATWLRTSDWMLERSTRRARLQAAATTVLPLGVLVIAVVLYRTYEIPLRSPGFSVAEFTRPLTQGEQLTLEMYQSAGAEMVPLPAPGTSLKPGQPLPADWIARVEKNNAAVELLLSASRRGEGTFYDPLSQDWLAAPHTVRPFVELLLVSAKHLQSEGELDDAWRLYEAALNIARHVRHRGDASDHLTADYFEQQILEHLPYWATHAQQSSDRIATAIADLAKLFSQMPSRESSLQNEYVLRDRFFSLDPEAARVLSEEPDMVRGVFLTFRLMPWEQVRARRLLNVAIASSLARLAESRTRLEEGGEPIWKQSSDDWDPQATAWSVTTPNVTRWVLFGDFAFDDLNAQYYQATIRRAALIQMALLAWRLDHGDLPEHLELLEDKYLNEIPVDPYAAQAFRYFPQGNPAVLSWQPPRTLDYQELPAETPFVWSAGPEGSRRRWPRPTEEMTAADKENFLLEQGWIFPLPLADGR